MLRRPAEREKNKQIHKQNWDAIFADFNPFQILSGFPVPVSVSYFFFNFFILLLGVGSGEGFT